MRFKKLVSLALMTTMVLTSLVGCSNTKESDKSAKQENEKAISQMFETVKLAGGTDWGVPNPFLHVSRGPGAAKVGYIFDTLLEKDEEKIIPWTAKEWKIDGNKYTFKLNEGITFHDKKPLTANDVAFTLDYYKEHPPANDTLRVDGEFIVDNYKVVDDNTIEINVKENLATTLAKLGSFSILPKHIWENVKDPLTYNKEDALIGSGPYKYSSHDSASGTYEFVAYEDYKMGEQGAKKIQFVPVSDEVLAFENKEIDVMSPSADIVGKYENGDEYTVIKSPSFSGTRMMLNMEKVSKLQSVETRQGMMYALNREDYLQKIARGNGTVASAGFIPSDAKYYNDKVEKYDYNEQKAKELIKEGFEAELLCSNSQSEVKLAELVKADLEKVGINLTIKSVDSKVRDQNIREGNYELALLGNGGWTNDPDILRGLYSSEFKPSPNANPWGMGVIGFKNEKIDKLCNDQLKEMDSNKRTEMIKELQVEISKEVPILPLICESTLTAYRTDGYNHWMMKYDYPAVSQNRLSFINRK